MQSIEYNRNTVSHPNAKKSAVEKPNNQSKAQENSSSRSTEEEISAKKYGRNLLCLFIKSQLFIRIQDHLS